MKTSTTAKTSTKSILSQMIISISALLHSSQQSTLVRKDPPAVTILKGDTLSVNLDELVNGDHIEFKLQTNLPGLSLKQLITPKPQSP
jgi:endonuclease YncB( thermonuclease family)